MTGDRQQRVQAILAELVASQAISLALLANDDGFLIAAVPESEPAQVAAAVGASIQQLAARMAEGMAVAEVAVRFDDRQQLVCRSLPEDQAELLLCVVVQPGRAYRRLTNQAVYQLGRVWSTR